ncbi:pseudouridine synthase [Alkalihalobacillus sp. AL-G]|uniref:pseudouridine synthase n=1 Tax=Alkalihalobacillus sp. AL-G TaxID=2926399 RepID=UPI00272D5FFF|nr:pseudouridine synthase [Alkalihalobacillus sp. AL-G]WLD91872.1 rRNA pseudouridine synthase [Alkalihalobacillus sp. AL-G]
MDRLQKVIAQAGITSRRNAEKLIQDGKVKVNGTTVTELGTKASPSDEIEVNGVKIEKEEPVYFLFYKPTGVISSAKDEKGRKVVTDFFPEIEQRIFPIGRLDYDTSGLLLMTNDGEFANLLMHPKYKVEKHYIVKTKGIPSKHDLKKLSTGVRLEDGKTAPAKIKLKSLDKKKQTAIIEITIHEGKNRQVRRMFEAIGYPIQKLKRERYGLLDLKGLNPGESRRLTPHEIKQLRNLAVTQTSK